MKKSSSTKRPSSIHEEKKMIPNETSKPIVASGGHMRTGSYDVAGVTAAMNSHNASFHSSGTGHMKKKSISNMPTNYQSAGQSNGFQSGANTIENHYDKRPNSQMSSYNRKCV